MISRSSSPTFSESAIDAIFAEVNQCHLPGAAVGIAIGGKPVYRKGFGLANLELPTVLSPSIRMRTYSMTKHFTCFAYLLLCEDRAAGVDDPVGKHLPELHLVARDVTLRHLMTNTSGLRDAEDILWNFNGAGHNVTVSDIVSMYRGLNDVNFAPGSHWTYNNGGFVLIAAVVERISGMSFEEFLRSRIFIPVGMHDTLLRRFDTDFVPNSASMHMTKPSGGFERSYLGAMSGEGGIASTVDDMLRWMEHMDAPVVGSAETWALMMTPATLANGTSTGYGLGLHHNLYRGVEAIHHSGGGLGANSQMLKIPSLGLDIVVLVNRYDVSGIMLADRIFDACVPSLDRAAQSISSGPAAAGTFRSQASGCVAQLKAATADGHWVKAGQQVAVIDGNEFALGADASGVLRVREPLGSLGSLSIELYGDRRVPDSLRLTQHGNSDELVRQAPPNDKNADSILGLYRMDAIDTEARIVQTNFSTRMSTTGRFGSALYTLECLSNGIWCARSLSTTPWGGILSFDGRNAGFSFSSACTHRLYFRRCT